jgi:hypothetical protein
MTAAAQRIAAFRVRPMDVSAPGERSFACATWVRGYMSSPTTKRVPQELYFEGQSRLVTRILSRATVLVAESADHPVLFGWIAGERDDIGPVVHYVYVKNDYRAPGMGVGRALVVALLEQLGAAPVERRVRRSTKRDLRVNQDDRVHWESLLECGHRPLTDRQLTDTALCGLCSKVRVRYSHATAPAMHWANAIGWQYDPYPAYF